MSDEVFRYVIVKKEIVPSVTGLKVQTNEYVKSITLSRLEDVLTEAMYIPPVSEPTKAEVKEIAKAVLRELKG